MVLLLVWFVLRGGLASLWYGAWRWSAIAVAGVIAAGLSVEYLITTARRRRGLTPFSWAVAATGPVERVQATAGHAWEAHPARPRGYWRRRRLPWLWAALLVVAGAGTWNLMRHLDATSETTYQLSRAFQHWRDLENWAGVPPDRRAAPGPALRADGHAPVPRLVSMRRRAKSVRVNLRCGSVLVCRGIVRVHARNDRLVASHLVRLAPGGHVKVTIAAVHVGRVVVTSGE